LENGKITNLMKYKIEPISGDASFRTFHRIVLNKKSRIIVYAKKEKYNNLIAYSSVNKFLRKNKILTPKLFAYNLKKGIIVIEDFGDTSFDKIILKKKNKLKDYKRLIDLLLKIQKIKPKTKIQSIIKKPHLIKQYSIKQLHQESDLFFKWYLPIFFTKKKVLIIKKKMRKLLSNVYKKLHFENNLFVHRDFHLQNLMKVNKNIGVIDTQDALIGNPAYDLASLIDDVRIKTSKRLKDQIFKYYILKAPKNYKNKYDNFLNDFNILSVQRSLKIIGIFSRLFKRDKKSKYLKLIPYTWQLLEERCDSQVFLNLKEFLDKNINKKIRKKIIFK
jgi:N-acetylmuramate 1-kinase